METVILSFGVKQNFIVKYIRKLIVPPTDYPLNSHRKVSRNSIKLLLDISNEVDHFIYFNYKDTTFEAIQNEIKQARVILDIGGNIGAFALIFEKLAPHAIIHTFEPHPVTYQRLLHNLSLNDSKVVPHNLALSDRKAESKLYEVDVHNTGRNGIFDREQDLPYVPIVTETLDGFWISDQPIDFIKMDTEGHETAILRGAKKTIVRYKPMLVIEIDDTNLKNNGSSPGELIEHLKQLPYSNFSTVDKMKRVHAGDDFTQCHFDLLVTP